MPRPQPVRLREIDDAPAADADMIDAKFKVVGRKRRVLGFIWRGLVAAFWAALIGFLIPFVWIAGHMLVDVLS